MTVEICADYCLDQQGQTMFGLECELPFSLFVFGLALNSPECEAIVPSSPPFPKQTTLKVNRTENQTH